MDQKPLILKFNEKLYRKGEQIAQEAGLTAGDVLHGATAALAERMAIAMTKGYSREQLEGEFEQLAEITRRVRAYADQAVAWRKEKEKADAPAAVL